VVHIRPTVFLDTPMFTTMVAQSIQDNGTIALPFGSGRTSPVASGAESSSVLRRRAVGPMAGRRDFYLEPVTKRLQGEAPAADQ